MNTLARITLGLLLASAHVLAQVHLDFTGPTHSPKQHRSYNVTFTLKNNGPKINKAQIKLKFSEDTIYIRSSPTAGGFQSGQLYWNLPNIKKNQKLKFSALFATTKAGIHDYKVDVRSRDDLFNILARDDLKVDIAKNDLKPSLEVVWDDKNPKKAKVGKKYELKGQIVNGPTWLEFPNFEMKIPDGSTLKGTYPLPTAYDGEEVAIFLQARIQQAMPPNSRVPLKMVFETAEEGEVEFKAVTSAQEPEVKGDSETSIKIHA